MIVSEVKPGTFPPSDVILAASWAGVAGWIDEDNHLNALKSLQAAIAAMGGPEGSGEAARVGSIPTPPNAACSEISLPLVEQVAECLVGADTDEHGIDDWKHYRHMAEAIIGLFERRTTRKPVSLEKCAAASYQACINHYNGANDPLNNPQAVHTDVAKAILDAAGVAYGD